MTLKLFRKNRRLISCVLIVNLVAELCMPLKSYASAYHIQVSENPVSASVSSMVDGYTGDFRYSVPLLNLPGPNGENVPISVNYHAGIGVNQKSSWVGLGWDYNPGEISRQIIGAPDDYCGSTVTEMINKLPIKSSFKFGSIYNNAINNVYLPNSYPSFSFPAYYKKNADVKICYRNLTDQERIDLINTIPGENYYESQSFHPDANSSYRFKRATIPHKSLAYDQYFVSGQLSGQIKPYFLGDIDLHPEDYNPEATGFSVKQKKAQFYFENSTNNTIDINSISDQTKVNQTSNEIHSGTRVKYFTNYEINQNSNLFNNSTNSGFLDFFNFTPIEFGSTRRPSIGQNSLIGAFQITDPSGITYHYSLPVLSHNDKNYNWNSSRFYFSESVDLYASSWKLTAITGQDYQDANNNHTADEGDTGYWISYNYSRFNVDYYWSSQRFGAKSDASISPNFLEFVKGGASGNKYSQLYSFSSGHSEIYYLDNIKTATHTVYFVKSIRKDEQSYDNVRNSTLKPKALLKLDKIVLLKNEDKSLLENSTAIGGSDIDSRFNYTGSSLNFVNITRYNAYKNQIESAALKIIEFETNYSLAKYYTGNINNSFSKTNVIETDVIRAPAVSCANQGNIYTVNCSNPSSSDISNSGKLTLKKIKFYDDHHTKITPSIDFDYDENNPIKNPDFNQDKCDMWGYYKNDYVNSHYVTNISKNDVDAWSLKEINTSLGGKIKIQYESDVYNKEGFLGESNFIPVTFNNNNPQPISVNIPHLIFPISNITSNTQQIFVQDADYSTFVELYSPPSIFQKVCLVANFIDRCSHPIVDYNGGNSHYYPDPVEKLIRWGKTFTGNTYYPGSQNPSYSLGPVGDLSQTYPEYDLSSTCEEMNGYHYSKDKTSGYGVDYFAFFRSYLYGGGVRVKQIDVIDPFKNDTYSQKFSYGDGYCPVVPKAMEFASANNPSPLDINMNTKPLINSAINSVVGYDFMSQSSISQNGDKLGSIVQYFNNNLISNPLEITDKSIARNLFYVANRSPNYEGGCYIGFYPGNDYKFDYTITLDSKSNSAQSCLLGKIQKSILLNSNSQEVSSTFYNYSTKFNQERFTFNTWDYENYKFNSIVTVPINHQIGPNCKQVMYSVIAKDIYNYRKSDVYTYNSFLSSTSTTKDGITISESIIRDSYTNAPNVVITNDPTQGIFENYTIYGYNSSAYPSFGLKTVNEANRNLPGLMLSSITFKKIQNLKYVMSESFVTYSNNYPIRNYSSSNNKYITTSTTHPWYRLNETHVRKLDDDVLSSVAPQSSDYRKTSTGTLYDVEGNRIEEEGLNQRKSASKWGYNNHYKLADISNANYNSFTFSSFEDQRIVNTSPVTIHFGGEITNGNLMCGNTIEIVNNVPLLVKPHAGYTMAKIASNQNGPQYYSNEFEIGRTYIAKVWVHKSSPSTAALNISLLGYTHNDNKTITKADPSNIIVGDWVLMSTEIVVPSNFVFGGRDHDGLQVSLSNVSGTSNAYFDDLSFHPKDAVITGNVYNEKTGLLIAQLDNENFSTLYNYDDAGRIISTYKEYSGGTKKVSENQYHFFKP